MQEQGIVGKGVMIVGREPESDGCCQISSLGFLLEKSDHFSGAATSPRAGVTGKGRKLEGRE